MAPPSRRSRAAARASAASTVTLALLLAAAAALAGAAAVGADHTHTRRLLIRPMPGTSLACRNTLVGPWMYADDKGVLCEAGELDHKSGCCRRGDKHSCATCDARDQCCEQYEACVSCCLAPANGAKARLPEVPRIPGKPASGRWRDEFELCAAVCRTHRASTAHENAYISPRHHCFSRLGKPLLSPPLPPGALAGVTVVLGAPGLSCDAACDRAAGGAQMCSARHLPLLDACDRLRESSACEAGCVAEAAPAAGGAATAATTAMLAPFYADGDAPKAERPALCVTGPGGGAGKAGGGGGEAGYSCTASKAHARRLCPCVPIPGTGSGNAAAAGAQPPRQDQKQDPQQQQQQQPSGDGANEEEDEQVEQVEDDDKGADAEEQLDQLSPQDGDGEEEPADESELSADGGVGRRLQQRQRRGWRRRR